MSQLIHYNILKLFLNDLIKIMALEIWVIVMDGIKLIKRPLNKSMKLVLVKRKKITKFIKQIKSQIK